MFLATVFSTACAATQNVAYYVLRPAPLNLAAISPAIRVRVSGSCCCDAITIAELTARLSESIDHGRNRTLHSSEAAGITLDAEVLRDRSSQSYQLHGTWGWSRWGGYSHPTLVTYGDAVTVMRYRFIGPNGELIESGTATGSGGGANSGSDSAEFEAHVDVVRTLAERFEPSVHRVAVSLSTCGWDSRCRRGIDAASAGNLRAAESAFTEVVAAEDARGAAHADASRLADALFDRGWIRALRYAFADAVADMARGEALAPQRREWAQEVETIRALETSFTALRAQRAFGDGPPPLPRPVSDVLESDDITSP